MTGFHISTTLFASGFATLSFIIATQGEIPLFYGSSFSYIAVICGITFAKYGVGAPDALIAQVQFDVIISCFVSIAAGLAQIIPYRKGMIITLPSLGQFLYNNEERK